MFFVEKGQPQYKANLHSHTTLSDGKLTPEQVVRAYRDKGYSILALTDHEYPCEHNDFSDENFLMITGYEAYIRPSRLCIYDKFAPEIHLNLIAREKKNETVIAYDPVYCKYMPPHKALSVKHAGKIGPRTFSVPYIQAFINEARKEGYLVSLNHPCWSMQETAQLEHLEGLWSVEVFNTGSMLISDYAENMPVYDFLLRHGKNVYCHGADDNHNKLPFEDPMSDSFGAWTMVMAKSLNYSDVIDALEKGRFYASTGPTITCLEIKEGKKPQVHLECTPATRITMHMTPKYSKVVYDGEGKCVLTADFTIPDNAPYVYFSVTGDPAHGGGKAYTHAFYRQDYC